MAYHQFAMMYDELMQDAPYDKWAELLQKILKHHQIKAKSVVDLGCGTGEITWRLKAASFPITGVDLSSEMLTIAKDKASEQGYNIPFMMQDITELEGFNETDVFFSFCDVINYITDEEGLKRTFDKVFNQLSDQGLFIFDMHDYHYGKTELANHTFSDETDEVTYIWDCLEIDADTLMHVLTFFKLKENEMYQKFAETHYQKLYKDNDVIEMLKKTGFKEIIIFGDFQLQELNLDKTYTRKFFIAKK